jgi:hypothetical protein
MRSAVRGPAEEPRRADTRSFSGRPDQSFFARLRMALIVSLTLVSRAFQPLPFP